MADNATAFVAGRTPPDKAASGSLPRGHGGQGAETYSPGGSDSEEDDDAHLLATQQDDFLQNTQELEASDPQDEEVAQEAPSVKFECPQDPTQDFAIPIMEPGSTTWSARVPRKIGTGFRADAPVDIKIVDNERLEHRRQSLINSHIATVLQHLSGSRSRWRAGTA